MRIINIKRNNFTSQTLAEMDVEEKPEGEARITPT